jgi:hypothetical protein
MATHGAALLALCSRSADGCCAALKLIKSQFGRQDLRAMSSTVSTWICGAKQALDAVMSAIPMKRNAAARSVLESRGFVNA